MPLIRYVVTSATSLFLGIAGLVPALATDKLPVVASFSILADLVENVGGERVEVSMLVGPDGDGHTFQPSPADAKTMAAARLVFVNGFGFEGWMPRLVEASGTKAPIIETAAGLKAQTMDEDGQTITDPHVWQSVANTEHLVVAIRDGLDKADPAGKPVYDANAQAYLAKLEALESEVKTAIAAIPAERRRIITSHDAFGYFGTAYGMSFIAPQGVSTDTEASAQAVAKIIRQIRAEKIPAVFLENISDPRLIRQIADETGAKIGGTVFSDALSAKSGPAGTYIDMMRHNIREFASALGS